MSVACFLMLRVDLFVTSLFIVTIVKIHLLILDVCGSKNKTSVHTVFSKMFILLLDLKL